MARVLTETTDYSPSWRDIDEAKDNGELSEAIECIFSAYDRDMDALVYEIALAIKDGHLKTLQRRMIQYFEQDEDIERRFDTTRLKK